MFDKEPEDDPAVVNAIIDQRAAVDEEQYRRWLAAVDRIEEKLWTLEGVHPLADIDATMTGPEEAWFFQRGRKVWPGCETCSDPCDFKPSHEGSQSCESGSIASGGHRAHCTCDTCF